jgi:hypothetical protein
MVRLLCWVSRPHFGAQGLIMSYNVTTLLDQPSDQGTLSSAGGWKDWERRWSLSARGLDIGNGTKQAEFTLKLAPGQIVPSCWNARRLTAPGLQCAPSAYTVETRGWPIGTRPLAMSPRVLCARPCATIKRQF